MDESDAGGQVERRRGFAAPMPRRRSLRATRAGELIGLDRSPIIRLLRRTPLLQGVIAGLLAMATASGCVWTCYTTALNSFRRTIHEDLLIFARLAAQRVDPEAHARLTSPDQQNGPEYLAVVTPLRRAASENPHVHYIYTLRPDGGQLRYVVDTGLPIDADGDGMIDQARLGEPFDEADPTPRRVAAGRQARVSAEPYVDRWGSFFSAYVPVLSKGGTLEFILGVDMDAQDYLNRIDEMRRSLQLSLGVAAIFGTIICGCVIGYQRSRRLNLLQLARSEQRYALAVGGTSDGLWDVDLTTGSIYLSPPCLALLGYDDGETTRPFQLDWFFDSLHPRDRDRVRAAIRAHEDRGEPYDVEYRLHRRDGTYRWFRARGQVARDESGRAVRMVGSLSDVEDRVALQKQLRRAARLDRLTRLPNRSTLVQRLRRAVREHRRGGPLYAVLFLDFDRFKIVNDSLGHEAGDRLLIGIAERLRRNLRGLDEVHAPGRGRTAARLGGDEFVVLLEGLHAPSDAVSVAGRLLRALAEPYEIGSYPVTSTASIGIVVGDPAYRRAEDVLRDADTAMYEAKEARRGTFAVFDGTMRERVRRRMRLEQGLRAAIEADDLDIAYQPIVGLETGRVASVEALVRWDHPELGRIPPDEFVPLAEECGLIVPLSERVLERSFRQLRRWRDEFAPIEVPGVSVNLARQHLLVPELGARLAALADQAGIAPRDVHLEITEGAVMQNPQVAVEALRDLHARGFRLAVDDFGTGYSSLACLHQFPLDLLKIDRAFVEGLTRSADRAAIVQTITSMARILGFRVVAEGIETAEQYRLLRDLGCDFGQGYYFARPTPADTLAFGLDFSDSCAASPASAISDALEFA